MKVLFVCRANVGRSQAAAAIYNQMFPRQAASAGTLVDVPGEQLKDRPLAKGIIDAMKEHGIDISSNVRTQLTEEMLDAFDKIVVMAEPETIPSWLSANPKTIIWTIPDPKGKSLEETRDIVKDIKARVEQISI